MHITQKLVLMFFSIKFLFPTQVEWALYSDYLKTIYVGSKTGISCIKQNDWRFFQTTSSDTILKVGKDINLEEVYANEVDEFNLAIKGTRAAWIEKEKIVIFDLYQQKVEHFFDSPDKEEKYMKVHIDPCGKTALTLVEIDKQEESSILCEWRVLDIDKNSWIVLDAKPTTFPATFLTWLPSGQEIIFYDKSDGITSIKKIDGSQTFMANLLSSPDMSIESCSFSPDGKLLALCCQNIDGQAEIFIYSKGDNKLKKLTAFQTARINPDNISWSPLGNWILFRDVYSANPILRMISLHGKKNNLFSIPRSYSREPMMGWLADGKHIWWFSQNTLNITGIIDDAAVPRK